MARARVTGTLDTHTQLGPVGKCPGGTVYSITCIRHHINYAEEEDRRSGIQQGEKDADGRREESTHRSQEEDSLDWKESVEKTGSGGKRRGAPGQQHPDRSEDRRKQQAPVLELGSLETQEGRG
ncbi:hypothetical protein NDU88_001728 [Pleurodeles waltl]|uniref:Uncharacterized protein n=1 Tax=Pleurodeles waltl TaxID=8319 RepID=A0AAV7V8K9_PLEWA|nr:hypothetical protein NDU88_001728 [Pleurodeles waltl]